LCPNLPAGVSPPEQLDKSNHGLIFSVINKDRHEEAVKSLIRYHRSKTDPDNVLALAEYRQIRAQHEEDEKENVTWKQMFIVPSYRRRVGVAAFVMIGSQMAATLLVSGMYRCCVRCTPTDVHRVYNPILYGSLGYGVPMQLVFTGIWAIWTIIGNTICAFTIDRMGRTLALKIGWIGNAAAMIGIVVSLAMFEKTQSRSAAISAIFFLYVQIIVYATFVDATT
jgi:hypothetical protein